MISYIKNIIFNPLLICFRFWRIIYIPLLIFFNLDFINQDTPAHSHVLSLVYSIITSIITPYSYYLIYNNYILVTQVNSYVSNFIFNISTSYFLSDLIIGIQYYPTILNKSILTSYIHHSAYIFLFTYGKYYNNIHLYILGLPYEIPTILLNLGYIDPRYRNDNLFALLFFIFRILHNLLVLKISYTINTNIFIFSIFTFILHSYWFINYMKRYRQIPNI
jgi:hypothetical protein